jgi:hypothetical protein
MSFVYLPSPGRMTTAPISDPLTAWKDCYEMKPRSRIKVSDAKSEIQRAWTLWDGDKKSDVAMFIFFGWLQRHRPYFLTFRTRGDPWQRVHSWLLQHERGGQK